MANEETQVLSEETVDNNVSPTPQGGGEATTDGSGEGGQSSGAGNGSGQENGSSDFLTKAREVAGRDIDEEYLKVDYRAQFNSAKEKAERLAAYFGEEPDDMVKAMAEFKTKGGTYEQFFEAQLLDPEKMSEGDLLRRHVIAKNPDLAEDKDLVDFEMRKMYGVGRDLETLKEDDPEAYMEILRNRKLAIAESKRTIADQKVKMLTPPAPAPAQTQDDGAELQRSIEATKKEVDGFLGTFEKVEVSYGDGSKLVVPVDKAAAAEIAKSVLANNDGILALQNVSPQDVIQGIYLQKNINSIIAEVEKTAVAKAEKAKDEEYNNRNGVVTERDKTATGEEQKRSNIRGQISSQL